MPRALTFHRSIVPLSDRTQYLQRLRARRAYYRGVNCHFWVFEETDLAGAFLEFIEAADRETLAAALASAPEGVLEGARVFGEVELD